MNNDQNAWEHLKRVTQPALMLAPGSYIEEIRANLGRDGIVDAVAQHHTPLIFDWLVGVCQYQGISDANAAAFAATHGIVSWDDIRWALDAEPACHRLQSYWNFEGCHYRKAKGTCSEPELLPSCSLPRHPTRKGSLIQAAYSLFFFVRDICDGDFVGWVDDRLAATDPGIDVPDRAVRMGAALLESLGNIRGLGQKVLSMALADSLLAGDPARER